MKRSLVMILILGALLLICAPLCDSAQQACARKYLDMARELREPVERGELEAALYEQAYMHALWQGDEKWLNCIISHHHTRSVSACLTRLATALSEGWRDEAIRETDALIEALTEIEQSDSATIENIL